MQVPMLDLKAQYAAIRGELLPAVQAVVDDPGVYVNGPPVKELEQRLAEYCGCAAAVGVSSGTDALLCSLMALEIGAGDEVITTPFTFFATAGCIWRAGARPVFVDIEPKTFNLDPSKLASAITPKTKGILPVHLFGQMAEMDPILEIARKFRLHVIEDAAQSIGAEQQGRKAGSVGTVGCLSFYPTKNLAGLGDAGMVTTQDRSLAEKVLALRQHGENTRYYHRWVGGNFRLDTIQAAALLVKLRHLEGWTARRRANAARYDELLAGCEHVVTPTVRPGNVSVYNQYVIRAERRNELQGFLRQQGIGSGIYYPLSLHEQECFSPLGYKRGDFPQSERAAAEVLALPIYPELTDEQIAFVAGTIKKFYA